MRKFERNTVRTAPESEAEKVRTAETGAARRKASVLGTASAILGGGVVATALVIMARGAGLRDELDFGAGSYYYADIPDFDKYLRWDAFTASLPYWVYVVLFLAWGALMYLLWRWVDGRR